MSRTLDTVLDRSRLVSALRVAAANASTPRLVRATTGGSRVVRAGRRGVERTRTAVGDSTLGRIGRRAAARFDAATRTASLTGLARRGERATRESWLYRWLTAEPEPDVVVIDLRETLTVGPFVRLTQEAVREALPAWPRSLVGRVAERGETAGREAPVRVASLLTLGAALAGVLVGVLRGFPTPVFVALIALALVAAAGTRVTLSWRELRESWLGRWVAAVLEPPEPPDERDPPR